MRLLFLVALCALGQSPDDPRPIPIGTSLWTEELTTMEVRDRVRAGYTTVLIGTGGIEQNGPYVATGKHNYVLEFVMPYIARAIGKTLIAPIFRFVPEGAIEPKPEGHMRFAGAISVEQSTFIALLRDLCKSYAAHGFKDIILIGDSGGNQVGMKAVARELNVKWKARGVRVHYLPEYYEEDMWSYQFLKSKGVVQKGEKGDAPAHTRNGIHDDVYYEAQIAALNPELIRAASREKAGLLTLHGVKLSPIEKTAELGRQLAAYRADIAAKAFRNSLKRLRSTN